MMIENSAQTIVLRRDLAGHDKGNQDPIWRRQNAAVLVAEH